MGYTTNLFIYFSPLGLGLAFIQENPEKENEKRLIWCHSSSLTSAQSKYYAIIGEGLALVWALQKCDFWLKNCPQFNVITDHAPLVNIFNSKSFLLLIYHLSC